jgi:hypothetical protein
MSLFVMLNRFVRQSSCASRASGAARKARPRPGSATTAASVGRARNVCVPILTARLQHERMLFESVGISRGR